MADTLIIASSEAGAKLVLSPLDANHFLAHLSHGGLTATARVGSYLAPSLSAFFSDLAQNWKGWQGTRGWETLEGELTLSAESDSTGHVFLRVHLHDGALARWTVEAGLTLEAGQLDRLAGRARSFEQLVLHAS